MGDYKQVSCNFYDQLTDLITVKKYVHVEYSSDIGEFLKQNTILKDIVLKEKQEYLVLNSGDEIRLDRLKKVDDIIPPHVADNYYQCDC